MNDARSHPVLVASATFLASPRFVTALTTVTVAMGATSFAIVKIFGWAGYIGALSALVLLALASGLARRQHIDWQGLLPISLIAFLSWSALSIVWSGYQWATLSSLLYQFAFAGLAVYIALNRDMIQIVRVFGNVLRFVLGTSLVLELVSGIIVDSPIPLLSIEGNLATGEPVQGLPGDSTQLGILALIGGITFWVELATKSVERPVAVLSLVGAAFMVSLTHSTVITAAAIVVTVAALVLEGIRRVRPAARQPLTWALLSLAVVALVVIVIFRTRILDSIQGSDQLANKLGLWRQISTLIEVNNLQGWGWIGKWRTELPPYVGFPQVRSSDYASAFNSILDVWFQLGFIGVVIFCVLIGLALVRSWHLAVRQPSVVYLWPALILVCLISTAVTESSILIDFCWLTLIICVVKSASKMSWRLTFARIRPAIE